MGRRTPPSTAPPTVSSTIAGRNRRLSLASVLMQPPRPPTQSHPGYPILSSSPPTSAETISSSASPPSWNRRTHGHPTTFWRSRETARMTGGEPGRVPAGLSLDNWLSAPYSQWSFQHVEDLVPTAIISRGTGPVAALPAAGAPVAEIPVTSTDGVATTVGALMASTATDGWAVAYRGSMVAEEYLNGLGAQTRHLLFSVSKSLVAAVVGALHGAGAIEVDAPVTAYVPALANCGYAGATVRHLLDMRSGIAFLRKLPRPGRGDTRPRAGESGGSPRAVPTFPLRCTTTC